MTAFACKIENKRIVCFVATRADKNCGFFGHFSLIDGTNPLIFWLGLGRLSLGDTAFHGLFVATNRQSSVVELR